MLKIKDILNNELVLSILTPIVILIILFVIMFISAEIDKTRCEKNGGIYIWEFSYGNKCHLK